jgi:hypothetical protein
MKLFAAYDGQLELRVVVWGLTADAKNNREFGPNCYTVIGEVTGQLHAVVREGGIILLPYGTAGLAWEHRWDGRQFTPTEITLY